MLPTNDLQQAREWLQNADHILIGAGAGLSSAAGIDYAGETFQREFADMIAKYGFGDLYSASFYPYPTEEEFWASWARHVLFARFNNGQSAKDEPGKYTEALPLYQQLLKLVRDKDYFVITTNVDGQFRKAGFDAERLFEVQGDYAYLQGKTGKSGKVYYSEDLFRQMVCEEQNGHIPTALIPCDPESGEKMDIHVRKDSILWKMRLGNAHRVITTIGWKRTLEASRLPMWFCSNSVSVSIRLRSFVSRSKGWQTNIATSLLSASTAIILLRNYRLTISSV